MGNDTYELVVVFSRSLNDDRDVVKGSDPSPQALAAQLAKELQIGYDETGIAGHFQVVSVHIDGEVHNIEKKVDLTHYQSIIYDATGITNAAVLTELEEVMRHDIFHSTLDWQTRGQLTGAAREAAKILDLRSLEERV